jgi:hypothetical protein
MAGDSFIDPFDIAPTITRVASTTPPSPGMAFNDPFDAAPPARTQSQPPQGQPWSGSVLPFSRDAQGNMSFDQNAGLVGAIWQAMKAPGEVWQGKLNPFSEEGQQRATDTALMASPTSAASRAGERVIPGVTMRPKFEPKAPTRDELGAAAKAGYNKVTEMGVDYSGPAVKSFADDAVRALNEEGFIAELGPKTHALLKKLQEPPADSVASITALDAFRRRLGAVAGSPDATEAAAANIIIKRLDKFLESPAAGSGMARGQAQTTLPAVPGQGAGTRAAEDAAQILRTARANSAAGFRSDELTGIADSASNRAAAANSGQNLGNNIRGRLASLLDSQSRTRGFSKEEIAAIQQVVDGTATTNTLRYVSNLLGGGGGIGQTGISAMGAIAGSSVGGLPGAGIGATLPPLVGAGARTAGNRLTAKQLADIDAMTRMRSPLYDQLLANAPYKDTPEMRLLMLRALMAGQTNGGLMGSNNPSLMD